MPFLERHAPSPSQVFWPEQPESASSVNFGTSAQVPSDPKSAHDWHVPHAALPQQTPSTQLPVTQLPATVQVLPVVIFGEQVPALQ